MKRTILGLAALAALGCNDSATPSPDATRSPESPTAQTVNDADPHVAADNTGVNTRDRDGIAKTPFDQSNASGDIAVTADIRKQIVATSMSVSAHNVKIITQNGKVTLRGPVATDGEKVNVERIAGTVAGEGNVTSEIEVDNQ
ncbi:MAG: BON domain-containing protein [Lacipirellulaceae bacterium]